MEERILQFCGGSHILDVDLLLNNTWPEFSPCFHHTVLVWVPCGWLWLTLPVFLLHLHRRPASAQHMSTLTLTKIIVSALLALLAGVDMAVAASIFRSNSSPASYHAHILKMLTFVLCMYLTLQSQRKGLSSSCILFIFWFLIVTCNIIPFYTYIIQWAKPPVARLILFFTGYAILFSQFVLHLFAERFPSHKKSGAREPCPETSAAFLSKITFHWITGLVWRGWRQPITASDLWDLPSSLKSEVTVPPFNTEWQQEMNALTSKNKIDRKEAITSKETTEAAETAEKEGLLELEVKRATSDTELDTYPGVKIRNKKTEAADTAEKECLLELEVKRATSDTELDTYPGVKIRNKKTEAADTAEKEGFLEMGVRTAITDTELDTHPGVKIRNKKTSSWTGQAKKWTLVKVLFRMYGSELLVAHLLRFCADLVQFLFPLLLKKLIWYVEHHGSKTDWKGYVIVASFFLVSMFQSIVLSQCVFLSFNIGLKIKTALVTAVYKKALTMNNESRRQYTTGAIVNMMSVDCARVQEVTSSLWVLWSAPLMLSVGLYFLYQTIGVAIFAGITVMLVLAPINFKISTYLRKFHNKRLTVKDQRLKFMNEVLTGIKVLKLYAWEASFREKITAIRNTEIRILQKLAILNSVNTFCFTGAPTLVTLTSFVIYVMLSDNHYLDSETAFVSLSLFTLIRQPMNSLPNCVSMLVQAFVSIKRLSNYLTGEDLDPHSVTPDTEAGNVHQALSNYLTGEDLDPQCHARHRSSVTPDTEAGNVHQALSYYLTGEDLDLHSVTPDTEAGNVHQALSYYLTGEGLDPHSVTPETEAVSRQTQKQVMLIKRLPNYLTGVDLDQHSVTPDTEAVSRRTQKQVMSIKRLSNDLTGEDLDPHSVTPDTDAVSRQTQKQVMSIKRLSNYLTGEGFDPQCHARHRSSVNVEVRRGQLVAVVGSVGAGKSSLLSALLGEMEKLSGSVQMKGSVAYVPQQAWIQHMTLRRNLLFGRRCKDKQYQNVIGACALEPDLDLLPGGDDTEIGEKGINLSGGQKQRVSLARAVYSDKDIYLMDDPLSAVDSHVGKHIFSHVIGHQGMLKDKTRILVTHGVQWLPMVDVILVMDKGEITEVGSYEELLSHDGPFAQFLKTYLLQETEKNGQQDEELDHIKAGMLQRVESVVSIPQLPPPSTSPVSCKPGLSQTTGSIKSDSNSLSESPRSLNQAVIRTTLHPDQHKDKQTDRQASAVELKSLQHLSVREVSDTGRLRERKDSEDEDSEDEDMEDEDMDEDPRSAEEHRLVGDEKSELGRVQCSVIRTYFRALGVTGGVIILFFFLLFRSTGIFSNVWLSVWTDEPRLKNLTLWANTSDATSLSYYYLAVYSAATFSQAIMIFFFVAATYTQMVRAAATLHQNLLDNVLRQPMAFFDTTPTGRIMNRFTRDVGIIDGQMARILRQWLNNLSRFITIISIISYSTPLFLVVAVPILVLYVVIQRMYIPTSRQLRRNDSTSRSPIFQHFSETISGATLIRAYGMDKRFLREFLRRVDRNNIFHYAAVSANRWLKIRLEFLGNLVIVSAAFFAVVTPGVSGGMVGLSVMYAVQVTSALNILVQVTTQLETNIVSVERIVEYTELPAEGAWIVDDQRPPPEWPEGGQVELDNLQVRYRPELDLVLQGITARITPGQKVGVVGRTGAGKSSLTLALFRILEAEGGSITIDGQDIANIGLHDLRSRLTILPQDPVLFSGSLRMNLDPFDAHSDEEVWQALEQAHLKAHVTALPAGLQHECEEGGQNLSVGQRQLVCLARSLLRRTKVLILDEATAAVDMETDELIQNTIRTAFSDCTVITIAHRLNTILDYDRILVLSAGQILEFDTPDRLLQDKAGAFYSLARDAGIVSSCQSQ
ncbi:multidrug resistance-associated protein 1-like [Haliotis rufescens]|uniref:multidrug resistance-associated protein 1-like n=1 Tax=Haliotis rufescens TaxID=6454 RepID=UPI00201F5402|nr:multidrug resistance-associated protein 1-like [Haliotis rufescens]